MPVDDHACSPGLGEELLFGLDADFHEDLGPVHSGGAVMAMVLKTNAINPPGKPVISKNWFRIARTTISGYMSGNPEGRSSNAEPPT
jgi:hypothetical protein